MKKIKTFLFFFSILFISLLALIGGFVACGVVWANFGPIWGGAASIAYVSAIFATMGVYEDT